MSKVGAVRCNSLFSASPLWTRAPSRDEKGIAYSDFMLLIPGLKQQTEAGKEACLMKIRDSLSQFESVVVYVDLNIKLSLLWVSHKPVPGIALTLVQAIQQALPQARVIAGDFNPQPVAEKPNGWLSALGYRVKSSLKRLT